ncbi:MAG: hypothetical protein JJ879_03610 [Sneathiella sp.]|nr:hypothetical protein [Sneathiella sp.]
MTSNAKFLFDTEFGAGKRPKKEETPEIEVPPALYTEEDRARFVAEAQQTGLQEGQAQALASIEAAGAEVLNNISGQLTLLGQQRTDGVGNIRKEAASLAFAIAKKLAPALIARQPETEVLHMIESCLADLHDEPRIVIRASLAVSDALQSKVEHLQAISGFQGKIILLPDETLNGSDCRIEWADGGVERDLNTTIEQMEAIVERFLRSQQDVG